MIGTLLAILIVFAILFVITRSIAYYRGEFSVAGVETGGQTSVRESAAIGAGAGLIVLLLLGLLYFGATQWEWFGHPAPKSAPVAVPSKQAAPPVLTSPVVSPSAGATSAPSPSP